MTNVVVICHLGRSGYNVLRSLSAIGARSYLITDRRSASIRWSRGSRPLHHAQGDFGPADDDTIVELINRTHARVGLTSVIATDVPSSVLLARVRHRLTAPVFPTAQAETLQQLDNKWEFARICMQVGVEIPRTLYFRDSAALDPEEVASEVGYPAIVKPASGFGQRGIVLLKDPAAAEAFRRQDAPGPGIVVQEYVPGQDWSVSVLAVDGVVRNSTAWECPSQFGHSGYGASRYLVTKFTNDSRLTRMVQTVILATGYSGIANFDARLADDGRFVLLECNPRVFNRLLAARICGLDFIAAGLPGHAVEQPAVLDDGEYYPWREALSVRGWRMLLRGSWKWRYLLRDLWEMVRDPLPPITRKIGREDEKAS